ncbi:MAG: PPC domain-containing protein, partial [Thermoguttaceae bacterium]|nr:PPC domain-containing protein [Thermoguttaceae bacterium]
MKKLFEQTFGFRRAAEKLGCKSKNNPGKGRRLRLELLESRELLSATTWDVPMAIDGVDVPDTFGTAEPLGFNAENVAMRTDSIGNGKYGAKDVDVFAITLNPGMTYAIETSLPNYGEEVDTYLRVFNSNKTQVAYADDGAEEYGYSKLIFTSTESTTYYIVVTSYDNRNADPNYEGSGVFGETG